MAAGSESSAVEFDKQGFLQYQNPADKKFSKKHKNLWFVLVEGSLFAYKTPLEATPLFTHAISGSNVAAVADTASKDKKKTSQKEWALTIKLTAQDAPINLMTMNGDDRDNWVAELTNASSKSVVDDPETT